MKYDRSDEILDSELWKFDSGFGDRSHSYENAHDREDRNCIESRQENLIEKERNGVSPSDQDSREVQEAGENNLGQIAQIKIDVEKI